MGQQMPRAALRKKAELQIALNSVLNRPPTQLTPSFIKGLYEEIFKWGDLTSMLDTNNKV